MSTAVNWGPSGETVFDRTYSRTKPNGERETWPETVARVAEGNLALVYGDRDNWTPGGTAETEYAALVEHMLDFKILPAGRHLWASGVKGRQYLMNCWVSGWGESLSDHFEFSFLRLMEGGGVGANYSTRFLQGFGLPRRRLDVHIVCDPAHPDYDEMLAAGFLSTEYVSDWEGAFEVADSREGWAAALTDLLDTFMDDGDVRHRSRVFDVSNVRGRGSRLKTFGGTASGPAPFAKMMLDVCAVMSNAVKPERGHIGSALPDYLTPTEAMEIDHAIAECVVSGGNRRSARMSIVHWDDPHIFEFLEAKADGSKHWTTNISVEVDDEFFEMIEKGNQIASVHEFHTDLHVQAKAHAVHKAVVAGMLTNGEPGYWNSSLSNHGEVAPLEATNPCGEIALQAWEACNLGHVNLDAFAQHGHHNQYALEEAHRLVTRMLVRATYADINDPKSRKVLDSNRRIGVGHLGVQGFLVKQGVMYSQAPETHWFPELLADLAKTVRQAAREYAFELRIPEPVKVTTVAPTGSVAKLPGATEGIHPILFRYFEQRIRFSLRDPDQAAQVNAAEMDGFKVETDVYDKSGYTAVVVYPTKHVLVEQVEALGYPAWMVEQADEIPFDRMLAFQAMYQKHYADNAVSFTVNVPEGMDPDKVSASLIKWLPSLKGTTIMVNGTREQAPYTPITESEWLSSRTPHLTVGDDIDLECATGACPIR